MNINQYTSRFTTVWDNSPTGFAFSGDAISYEQKINHEKRMIEFSKSMGKEVDLNMKDPMVKKQLMQQLKANMGAFIKHIFNYSEDEISIISQKGFMGVTKEFMKMAREFDPNVHIEDIFQASRNLWIINSLQIMMNEPVQLTSSVFAYSMLYPYTDNYLDNPAISKHEKLNFSKRFRSRLKGETINPANEHEKHIFNLVGLIEKDWKRIDYPEVYESLLAIHDAQTKSIFLVNNGRDLTEDELLEICIEKGGTSVLADGYLIKGKLTPEQEDFCYGFGTYLQFVDDIQDLEEDLSGNLNTVFTHAAKNNQLDLFINKSLSFGETVLSDLSAFPLQDNASMQALMNKSISFLISEAIGLNSSYISKEYVMRAEEYSVFRFDFIRKRRNKMESNRISFMKKLEQFIFPKEEKIITA